MRLDRILSRAIRAILGAGLAGAIVGLPAPEDALQALPLSRAVALYGPLAGAGVAAAALAGLRAFLASRRGTRPRPATSTAWRRCASSWSAQAWSGLPW